jgi:hypothetical protein
VADPTTGAKEVPAPIANRPLFATHGRLTPF